MKEFDEAVSYLYNCTPQFQLIGASAYKPGLDTARKLDEAFGSPHCKYKTIHVAGTNGKGSTAHTLASILQESGYKVGLYTSPHLVDFRERIRVNGEMISREGVVDFVSRYRNMTIDCEPSFFELTTIMAFDWFAKCNVDIAVIETGLGGRLDTTNIISPILSVITNISKDHVAQLGDTCELIAKEKAGIIKDNVPVVIGEAGGAVAEIFKATAISHNSRYVFACDNVYWSHSEVSNAGNKYYATPWGDLECVLSGECQLKNAATVMAALEELGKVVEIDVNAVIPGFKNVVLNTSLMGRWMISGNDPLVVCDTGHNTGGWKYLSERLSGMPRPLSMVIGFVSDKDVDHILEMMPKDAYYYFTQAGIPRAMSAELVAEKASKFGLQGEVLPGVEKAVTKASEFTPVTGSIFIGGSTFVVADYLASVK